MIDQKIICDFVKGKKKAFDSIYNAYASGMYAICLRYLRCEDDAKDVLQESFIKIYNARESFDTTKPIGAWIKTITIRTALNHIKHNYKMVLVEDENVFNQIENPVEHSSSSDLKTKLKQILNQLPEGYRTVFNLYAVENLTHKEIAEYLGIKEGTSKSQYSKAKRMIKELLEPTRKAS